MELTPELLLRAYAMGIFPMADSATATQVQWVTANRRGVFPIGGFHISRSLMRHIRRVRPRVTVNAAFDDVVRGCANRPETWINPEIFAAYRALQTQGHAHSLEIWEGETLAGGVYGVVLGGAFFGESMFSARVNGSKMALAFLMHRLQAGGFTLFDTQFLTDHLASLGAIEVPRHQYEALLAKAVKVKASFFPAAYPTEPGAKDLLQSASGASHCKSQTS